MNLLDEKLSDSMEMYLVTIARLRNGDEPVPLSQLAESLAVTSVSVNEMCRKLQDNGLVIYRPYKGAALTKAGEKLANHTLRRHRLWEVFLVEKLHFGIARANEIACVLEHATSDDVIDRMDDYLDFPAFSPRGLPIPKADHEADQVHAAPLTDLPVGESAEIVKCRAEGDGGRFLAESGIKAGCGIRVMAIGPRYILVEVGGSPVSLGLDLAGQVEVARYAAEKSVGEEINRKRKVDSMEKQTNAIQHIPLSQLKPGQEAVVVRIGGQGAVRRRMMDMGVVPGAEIHVVRVAPLGDPVEYSIKGYSLSLRKSEAEDIMIELKD